jgi:hypothetical protein
MLTPRTEGIQISPVPYLPGKRSGSVAIRGIRSRKDFSWPGSWAKLNAENFRSKVRVGDCCKFVETPHEVACFCPYAAAAARAELHGATHVAGLRRRSTPQAICRADLRPLPPGPIWGSNVTTSIPGSPGGSKTLVNFKARNCSLLLYCFKAIWYRFRYGVENFYLHPGTRKKSALYRDWMVLCSSAGHFLSD